MLECGHAFHRRRSRHARGRGFFAGLTLEETAEALNISAETLYARIGLVDEDAAERKGASGVEETIRLDPRLTTRQKETLLSVYRDFVGDAAESG